MDLLDRGGWKSWSPLFFSVVLIAGMILGFNLRDSLRNKRDIKSVVTRNDRLEQIIDLINEKYVDSVKSDVLYNDAVNGILKSLDPHTVYIPADNLAEENEELEGGFSGIGVEFLIVRDTINVLAVVDNGPAANAGIKVGDQLIRVGDSTIAGVNITTTRITHMLKGKQRTKVELTVKHFDSQEPEKLTLVRDMIPIHPVEVSLMLDDVTGYIKLNKFSATAHKEVVIALGKLKNKGAKQLILDIRDNPGGYLGEAKAIVDEFLDDNKLIVFTEGLHAGRTDYTAGTRGMFEKGRVAILVDESSASASEIVAGAIQDWDRGIILGRRTFGKGLVQEPYDMTDGSELRLTIARYYTPSGRCIQRAFDKGRSAYMQDYEKRFSDEDLYVKDGFSNPDTTRFFTAGKRIVYGGGGIKPDVFIPHDTLVMARYVQDKMLGPDLKNVAWAYFLAHYKTLKYRDADDFRNYFRGEDEILKNFINTLNTGDRRLVQRELYKHNVRTYFLAYIKAQIGRFLYRNEGFYTVTLHQDNMVNEGRKILSSPRYLKIVGR